MTRKHYFLVLPLIVILALISIAPLIYVIKESFFDYNMSMPWPARFSGFENYIRAFHSPDFWNSIRVSVDYLIRALSIQLIIGMVIALLLNHEFRFNNLFRVILASPFVIAPAVAAVIWRLMFNPQTSLINHWISMARLTPPAWLGSTSVGLWSIVIVDTWQWLPFTWLILRAGLSSLSPSVFEAARVDGAGSWRIFRYVTLPLLAPQLILVTLFRALLIFKDFDKIFVLTGGGPANATETLSLHTYFAAFWWFDTGYASALSVLYLIIVIVVTTILYRKVKL